MKICENIIQIRQRDLREADLAFAEFMHLVEECFNEKSRKNIVEYKQCDGRELEKQAEKILKEVAPITPFRVEDIKLISGAKFPDIQAGLYYGVEVKSTKSNTWCSTGSSIVESTRIKDVSKIYMLFGKLGGEVAEYRCRPYERCLSNIAVTHSPRYLIDMSLADGSNPTIFDKLQIEYDSFRIKEEKEKIQIVRNFYKKSLISNKKKKFEMPWWIGDSDSEDSSSIVIRFFSDIDYDLQEEIKARIFVLFTEIFRLKYQQKYKRAALWMCSRYSIIDNSLRDKFSAGGKLIEIGGVKFEKQVPQILNTLYNYRWKIKDLLLNPDKMLIDDICDFWSISIESSRLSEYWLRSVQKEFDNNPELSGLKIKTLLNEWGVDL